MVVAVVIKEHVRSLSADPLMVGYLLVRLTLCFECFESLHSLQSFFGSFDVVCSFHNFSKSLICHRWGVNCNFL